LSNGTTIDIKAKVLLKSRYAGLGTITNQVNSGIKEPISFVPEKFGFRRLGIADYKKVVSEVCCYREAEVSHIENIMAKEFKSKSTIRERIEENTITTENEVEVENLTDTTTSHRFEMQTEVARVLQQQRQNTNYATVTGQYNKITFETGANFANNSAKEESNRQAVIESKEITQRAMERIMNRFREEVVTKITERYKEDNSHVFDNREGSEHVSGVYRYINAIYKNQIYNYGKRLMYEFMVPQPSKLHDLGMELQTGTLPSSGTMQVVEEPLNPASYPFNITSAGNINELNYLSVAARYKAQVEAPPAASPSIGRAYTGAGNNGPHANHFNDLKIPEGYQVKQIKYKFGFTPADNNFDVFRLLIGNTTRVEAQTYLGVIYEGTINVSEAERYMYETIPVSVNTWDVTTYNIHVNVILERKAELYQNWQIKTYNAIIDAYRQLLDEYYNQVGQIEEETANKKIVNPLFYREIEQSTLKRICLSYLLEEGDMGVSYFSGDTFQEYSITRNQQMDDYTSLAKFMEQAFEWNIMSYSFYPYYWGDKNDWVQLYQKENDDPVFRSFMQAGMARVIVTVRPGFEDAVMFYMATGQLWNGGQMPLLGDKLYMSIVDELLEQEYIVQETWESVVPTSLNALQRSGVALDIDGLPCGGGCEIPEETQSI
jgi:hypothetical protein